MRPRRPEWLKPGGSHARWMKFVLRCLGGFVWGIYYPCHVMEFYSRPLMSHFFVLHASTGPNDPIQPPAMSMALDDVGLYGRLPPKRKGKCSIFQKNPHLYIYFLTTSLTVATKMILSNPFRLWDPPSCVEYRWPIHPSSITPYFLSKQWHNKVW